MPISLDRDIVKIANEKRERRAYIYIYICISRTSISLVLVLSRVEPFNFPVNFYKRGWKEIRIGTGGYILTRKGRKKKNLGWN